MFLHGLEEDYFSLLVVGANLEEKAPRAYNKATAVGIAAAQENLKLLQVLADAGADSDTSNMKGLTPLAEAALYLYPSIITDLLERKVNVNSRDFKGFSPLHYTAMNGGSDPTRDLLAAGDDCMCDGINDFFTEPAAS